MFGSLRKDLCRQICRISGFDASGGYVPHLRAVYPSFGYQQASAVSHLADSSPLSEEKPWKASKRAKIEGKKSSDSVCKLFQSYGFSKFEIELLLSKQPRLFSAKPEKTLKPKIEYIKSLGFSNSVLRTIICSNSRILFPSLKNQIIPTFDYLRGYVETNENVILTLQRSPRAFHGNIEKAMKPNVAYLLAKGVDRAGLVKLIMMRPQALTSKEKWFKKTVDEIERMGFDPSTISFILAIRTKSCVSDDCWNRKKELFMSFGWSESEFTRAFRLQPMLMMTSVVKIRKTVDFFATKLGLKPSTIAKYPNLFLLSLEGSIIPRCSVLKVLMSEDLLDKDAYLVSEDSPTKIAGLVWIFIRRKADFEKKFVIPYMEEVPEVMKAYKGEIDFKGFY